MYTYGQHMLCKLTRGITGDSARFCCDFWWTHTRINIMYIVKKYECVDPHCVVPTIFQKNMFCGVGRGGIQDKAGTRKRG